MTNSAVAPILPSKKNLQTIAVRDLRLGMIVHAIADQVGKLSVKSKGEVKHLNIIGKLTASGVKTIVIDNSPPKTRQDLFSVNVKNKLTERKKIASKNIDFKAQTNTVKRAQVSTLLSKSESIYSDFEKKIDKDISIDISEAKALVSDVYQNLIEDPESLLCITTIMNASDYLAKHSIHVATLICYFSQKLEMSKRDCEQLTLVGYLFDIGMVKIAQNIRNKEGPLNRQEFLEIQSHVQHSLDILSPLQLPAECLLAIEQHHERLDGSGYPNAYVGSKIHKFSRILAIVDSYDALTSMRKHQEPVPSASAMKILSNPANGYDQKLVLQFIRSMGVYPVGSLVILSNQCIALVTKTIQTALSLPEVNVFFSIAENGYLRPKKISLVDASNIGKGLRVIRPVLAHEYGLDIGKVAH